MKRTFLLDREYLLELRQRKYKQGLALQGEHRAQFAFVGRKENLKLTLS